jgi:hypothetical protein
MIKLNLHKNVVENFPLNLVLEKRFISLSISTKRWWNFQKPLNGKLNFPSNSSNSFDHSNCNNNNNYRRHPHNCNDFANRMPNSQSFSYSKEHQCCSGYNHHPHSNGRHKLHSNACQILWNNFYSRNFFKKKIIYL